MPVLSMMNSGVFRILVRVTVERRRREGRGALGAEWVGLNENDMF